MDDIDRRIVALLREDARRSFKDIGSRVGLSAPAVTRRVDRLEADGVIRGYTAMVDPRAFGWHAEAFVDLYCEGGMSGEDTARRAAVRQEGRGRRLSSGRATRSARAVATSVPLLIGARALQGVGLPSHDGRAAA